MPKNQKCKCGEMEYEDSKGRAHVPSPTKEKGATHDCDYVAARNSLIASAKGYADEQVPEANIDETTTDAQNRWTQAFAMKMERLAKPLYGKRLIVTQRAAEMSDMSDTYFMQLANLKPEVEGYLPVGGRSLLWTEAQVRDIASRRKR